MYLRITSRCNHQCDHCCYSCTEEGEDMSMEVLEKALESADDFLTLGGGEPTIHPKFWEIFGKVLGYQGPEGVFIITNGLETETCWTLAKLAVKGVVGVDFSFDEYHQPIDLDLEHFVREHVANKRSAPYSSSYPNREQSKLGYRKGGMITPVGRAEELPGAKSMQDYCPCEDIVVEPNGDVYACGHRELLLGTVWNWSMPEDWWDMDEYCSRRYVMGMEERRV